MKKRMQNKKTGLIADVVSFFFFCERGERKTGEKNMLDSSTL